MSNKIRFAVTGATGFIGHALCSELLRQGFAVHAYGRKCDFRAKPGIEYTRVKNYLEVMGTPDTVCVHLAGDNNVLAVESQTDSALPEAVALAKHLCTQRFARVVFASSAAVYGDLSEAPHREDEALSVSGAYARLKYAVEEVILRKHQTVARIANVYGLGMSETSVLSGVMRQLGQSGPVKVKCSMPVRDFIYVADVICGLICLATRSQYGIFNLGTGIGTSVANLARELLDIAGQKKRGVCCVDHDHIRSSLILNPSKMKTCYGWSARVSLREGLKELVASWV
ncbi:MAG: NAD(P)-dependent oxidoreductase [Candidatus Omnitrophota bacterium]